MSSFIEIVAIVEGETEQRFVNNILAPYFAAKSIYMTATQVTKPGQKGGDVKFARAKDDFGNHLKQRKDKYVTSIVDFYGIKEWPGIDQVKSNMSPSEIANIVNQATRTAVIDLYPEQQADKRFIPYIAVHEFVETLLFSDSEILAKELNIKKDLVEAVLTECHEPEAINNSPITAPSKRLDAWSKNGKFAKTKTGISIAEKIGINKMREKCPVFNDWLNRIEALAGGNA